MDDLKAVCFRLVESERRMMARELHDHVVQTLQQMNMQAGLCKQYLEHGFQAELAQELIALESQIIKASQELRNVISDLRPPPQLEDDFGAALQGLIESHHERGGVPVEVLGYRPFSSSSEVALTLLRIVQESLRNIRRHAQARTTRICFEQSETEISLTIRDDGRGFDLSHQFALVSVPGNGGGLINMQIRMTLVQGKFELKTGLGGTEITVRAPLCVLP